MPIKITPKNEASIKIVKKGEAIPEPTIEETASNISIVEHSKKIAVAYKTETPSLTMEDLLKNLSKEWKDFTDKPRAKVCRLLVSEGENAILDQFFEKENTTDKLTKDYFLKFVTEFNEGVSYSEKLIEELKALIKEDLTLNNFPVYPHWEEWKSDSLLQGPDYFTQNLIRLFDTVTQKLDSHIVAVIAPATINNFDNWLHWLGRSFELILPERVLFLLLDSAEEPILDDLVKAFPVHLYSAFADLNLNGFLKGLNEIEEAPNEFRDLFTQLIQTPAADNKIVTQLEVRLVQMTEDRGWPHMRIIVHNIVGQKLMEINLAGAAYKKYSEARQIAESVKDYENKGALAQGLSPESLKDLLPDTVFAQAMACWEIKEYDLGAVHFEEGALLNRKYENYTMEVLCRRFGGLCYEALSQHDQAWTAYNYALDAAEFLPEAERKESPIAEIGDKMIDLTKPLNLGDSRVVVRQRMIELLGPDWEALLKKEDP